MPSINSACMKMEYFSMINCSCCFDIVFGSVMRVCLKSLTVTPRSVTSSRADFRKSWKRLSNRWTCSAGELHTESNQCP